MIRVIFISVLVSLGILTFSCNQAQTENSQSGEKQQTQGETKGGTAAANPQKSHLTKAPDFALQNSKGETVRLSSFEDKVIILNFWATWCGPCRKEIPGFVELYKKYNKEGLEIIGVSVDQNGWQAVNPFVESYKINYPILMFNRQVIMDYGGIQAIPTTFIINRKGEIVERIVGLRPDSYFVEKIEQLL